MIVSIPASFVYGIRKVETEMANVTGTECSTSEALKDSKFPLIYSAVLFLVFLCASGTMITLYGFIIRTVVKQGKFRESFRMRRLSSVDRRSGVDKENSCVDSVISEDGRDSSKPVSAIAKEINVQVNVKPSET